MAIEITIRFQNHSTDAPRFQNVILTTNEFATCKFVSGGFYFTIDRSALDILTDIEADGYDISDFVGIEFRPA